MQPVRAHHWHCCGVKCEYLGSPMPNPSPLNSSRHLLQWNIAGFVAIAFFRTCCILQGLLQLILPDLLHFASFDAIQYCKVLCISQGLLQLLMQDLLPLPFAGFVASGRICCNRLLWDLLQLPFAGFVVIVFCRICCILKDPMQLHTAGFVVY